MIRPGPRKGDPAPLLLEETGLPCLSPIPMPENRGEVGGGNKRFISGPIR